MVNTLIPVTQGQHRLTVQVVDTANRVFKQTIYVQVANSAPAGPPASSLPPSSSSSSGTAPAVTSSSSLLSNSLQNDLNAASHWIATTSIAPGGAILYGSSRINPYYSNIASIGMTKDPARYGDVKNWMQWYINHLNWPDKWGLYGTTYDYNVNGSTETSTNDADSTDSYAATFLSLAWAYFDTRDAGAQAYVKTLGYQLEVIGGVIVSTQQLDGLTWAKPNYQIKYLMDNCEAYRGLRDLAMLFQHAFNNPSKAAYFNARADMMLAGIQNMWMGSNYGVYKDALGRLGPVNWGTWYADATSQLFPVLLGVISPSDPHATQIYATFNAHWPGWPQLSFQAQDPFPWVLVVDAAVRMGDSARVSAYMASVQNKYVSQNFPWTWYCAENGWYMRLNSYLL